MLLSVLLPAIGLYIATNIDDLIMLALLFARGAGQKGTTWRIILGHYLGFLVILGLSAFVALGGGLFLPEYFIPLFGLIPIAMGLWVIWRHFRGNDHDEASHLGERKVGLGTALILTLAHGGNNVGIYIPVFLNVELSTVLTYCAVFLFLVGGGLSLAKYIASRPAVEKAFRRWDHILYPALLIGAGVWILVEGYW